MKHGSYAAFLGLFIVLVVGACDGLFPLPTDSQKPGTDLSNATILQYDTAGEANLSGNVKADTGAVSVYNLGALAPGDRVAVAVQPASGSSLDPTIAIFNADSELFALNDDVDLDAGRLDSAIDEVIVEASDRYFLAISKFFMDSQGGDYVGTVQITRGAGVPARPTQTLLLDFDGGTIVVPGDGTYDLDAFDSGDVDAAYAGQTAVVKAQIVATVRENFEDTGVVVLSSDDGVALVEGTYSSVFFGAYSLNKFGVAQSVDQGNRDRCDDAIVFTDDFARPFASTPTVSGIGVAIGNVASHEAGHLLGLNHVSDITALMDTTGTASTLLGDQDFKSAPLHSSVFPFGQQDAMAILNMVVPK